MSKTNDLRKLVQSRLKTVCNNVFYEVADKESLYPHIVFSIDSIDLGDFARNDLIIEMDIWDKSTSARAIEDLADDVEELFNNANVPQETILPTFFLIDRKTILDPDKTIRHRIVRVQVQNYER